MNYYMKSIAPLGITKELQKQQLSKCSEIEFTQYLILTENLK